MTEPAIDTGEILEALNDKVDRDCQNVDTTSGADVVIEYQLPTSANGYKWYRLYKSGWLEQGGIISSVATSSVTNYSVTFLKNYTDTNYTLTTRDLQRYNASNPSSFSATKSTSGFSGDYIGGSENGIDWRTEGFAASSS